VKKGGKSTITIANSIKSINPLILTMRFEHCAARIAATLARARQTYGGVDALHKKCNFGSFGSNI